MDVEEVLRRAWKAVQESGVPPAMHETAFRLAVEMLATPNGDAETDLGGGPAEDTPPKKTAKAPAKRKAVAKARSSASPSAGGATESILSQMPDEEDLFKKISAETDVAITDLRDVFHVEGGQLELKVLSKTLSGSKAAGTKTVAALLAGAVLAGTSHRRLPFTEIHEVCRVKHCFDSANAASYVKSTPGFGTTGAGKAQALTTSSGWHKEFAKAVDRVLGRSDSAA